MKKTVDSVIFELLVVVFILLWAEVIRAEEYHTISYIIQRKTSEITGTTTLEAQPDRFIISSSLCLGNGSTQCEEMRGSRISNCTCECNHIESNSKSFISSTFGFNGRRWKCLENAKVHERWGCSVILNNWANDSALITVPKVGIANYEIPAQFQNIDIYKATSKYQKCDGSWGDLDYDTYIKKRFFVHKEDNRLMFNYSDNSSRQIISGQIITLGVGYYNASNMIIHTCVLLKMQGKIKCPFSLSLPISALSTTEPSFSSATVESSLSTSTRSANNPNIHTTSGGPSTIAMSTAKTSAPMVIKTSAKHSSSNGRSGLIAGAFAGAIGLLVLVIAIILVRRRKKRETVAKKSGVVAVKQYGTNRVQRSLEEQDEYSYADISVVSINEQDVVRHPKNKGPKNDVTNPKHGLSASSQPHISNISENPVNAQPKKPQIQVGANHNILEPVYAKVKNKPSEPPSDERVEPFYNVLEGPETDGPNEKEPPCYHLLEGPYPDGGPFYDVLEEPGSKALPIQHNASITIIDGKTDGKGNRDYKDTVYDSVEEVIPDTGDIYQQLNQDGQRETSVYQALTYANQAMPLTKSNAIVSEA